MSTSFYANAIIGIKIDADKIFIKKIVRNCSCEKVEITKDANFCPNCGTKAWNTQRDPIEGYDDSEEETLFGFKVINRYGYDKDDNYCIKHIYLIGAGAEHSASYDSEPVMLPLPKDINQLKAELKKVLEHRELWDESQFGLWAIGIAS